MLADRATLERQLRTAGLFTKKSLGQNFLVDPAVLQAILAAAELTPADHAVEVGAGLGVLTAALAAAAGRVTALEIDRAIWPLLQANLAEAKNAELQNCDVRTFVPPQTNYKLVANIPYYLTSPIIRQFLVEAAVPPTLAVLLVQREVAEKICDSRLTVLGLQARVYGTPELVCRVPARSFLPPPKVESAVLRIRRHAVPPVPAALLPQFFGLVHAGFRAPRKKIGSSLAAGLPYLKAETLAVVARSGVNADARPGELTIADWLQLLAALPTQPARPELGSLADHP